MEEAAWQILQAGSGRTVQVQNCRLHGYDFSGKYAILESFQPLVRIARRKLGLRRRMPSPRWSCSILVEVTVAAAGEACAKGSRRYRDPRSRRPGGPCAAAR